MKAPTTAVTGPLARSLGRRPRSIGDVAAFVLAAAATALFLARGLAYPLVVSDTDDAWGGPTMAGAWAVHLLIGLAILVAVALLLGRRGPHDRRDR